MESPGKILLLEDDPKLANEIRQFFVSRGAECDIVYDGTILMKIRQLNHYVIYILDIKVPGINGQEVCRQIRKTDKYTPIIVLTAFGEVHDKMEAFNAGADDFMVKPFSLEELMARIKALLRRSERPQSKTDEILIIKDLVINIDQMSATRKDKVINLTRKEFKLLVLLANAKGKPVSKLTISEQVWDYSFRPSMNAVEVYINFLRKKIDKDFDEKLIQTKSGVGYYLKHN